MITVTRIPPFAPPPATITIELDEKTAEVLCAFLGGIQGPGQYDKPLYLLFEELTCALPDRELSFGDLFENYPRYKP